MKRLALASALTAGVIAASLAGVGGAQTPDATTLAFFQDVAHESNSFVDNPPKSPSDDPGSRRFRLSAGDELVAKTPILDHRGGKRVGTLYAGAQVVSGTRFETAVFEATAVLALGDDSIVLAGLVGSGERPLAVTGGTGDYEGARGSAKETERSGGADLAIRLLR